MPRLKIQVPEYFGYSACIPIRITDINYGNHVGNDTILSLIHEARMQFLRHNNYTEMDIEGVSLIMSDVSIEFKSELFYGDVVTVFVTANEFSRVGFDVYYKMVKGPKDTLIAVAKTGMICYNYQMKKVVSVPDQAKMKLTARET